MENELINRRMIQWFPGHMTKTLRQMEKEIRNVDCVLQLLDARIPLSSLNPEIERITASKPHLYLLNKADLADPALTKQWITVDNYDLMDMPGVLWKKFDSLETATNLAFIGSIKDDILDIEELAMGLLSQIRQVYPERLQERYKLNEQDLTLDAYELLQAIGRKRGMLISGGEVNTERAAIMLVDEFRASKWGRITLEKPPVREAESQEDEAEELQ